MLLFLIISVLLNAVAIYALVDVNAAKRRFRKLAGDLSFKLSQSEAVQMVYVKKIESLEYDRDAADFMLETVMGELPDGHVFNIPNPRAEKRKEEVKKYLEDLREEPSEDDVDEDTIEIFADAHPEPYLRIPAQNGPARFKDH